MQNRVVRRRPDLGGAWIPPQIGNVGGSQVIPDGTVLAVRSVTLTSNATLVPVDSTTDKNRYYLAAGATWTGVRPDGSTVSSYERFRNRDPVASRAWGQCQRGAGDDGDPRGPQY